MPLEVDLNDSADRTSSELPRGPCQHDMQYPQLKSLHRTKKEPRVRDPTETWLNQESAIRQSRHTTCGDSALARLSARLEQKLDVTLIH